MAQTTAGALKQITESLGLGLSAYRDVAPPEAVKPYVIFTDGITIQTVNGGDGGTGDTVVENVQGDLYEDAVLLDTRRVAESPSLSRDFKKGLHGHDPVSIAGIHVYAIRVPFSTRARLADENTVRTRFSVDVTRAL